MRSTPRVAVLVVVAAAVLIVGFILASPGGSVNRTPPAVRHFKVTIATGKPAGGIGKLVANRGDAIDLTVTSDVADEIHVHGYDLHSKVAAGGSVGFMFKATIDGNFVIELESRGEQIASLTVKA